MDNGWIARLQWTFGFMGHDVPNEVKDAVAGAKGEGSDGVFRRVVRGPGLALADRSDFVYDGCPDGGIMGRVAVSAIDLAAQLADPSRRSVSLVVLRAEPVPGTGKPGVLARGDLIDETDRVIERFWQTVARYGREGQPFWAVITLERHPASDTVAA